MAQSRARLRDDTKAKPVRSYQTLPDDNWDGIDTNQFSTSDVAV
jgi:hypothetical protein